MTDTKFKLDALNESKYGVEITKNGDVRITRSNREWVYLYHGVKQPVDVREMLVAMSEELHDLRKMKSAMLQISNCDLPFGRLLGFIEREDAEDEAEAAYEFLASIIEPIQQAEDAETFKDQFKWVLD